MTEKSGCHFLVATILDAIQLFFAVVVIGLAVSLVHDNKCFLSTGEANNCAYAVMVGVISIVALVVLICLSNLWRCTSCSDSLASSALEIIHDVAQLIWWFIAFCVFVAANSKYSKYSILVAPGDKPNNRRGIVALCFLQALVFAIDIGNTVWAIKTS